MEQKVEIELNLICNKITQGIYQMSLKKRMEVMDYLKSQVFAGYLMLDPKTDCDKLADILGVEPILVYDVLFSDKSSKEPINIPMNKYRLVTRCIYEVQVKSFKTKVFEVLVERNREDGTHRLTCSSDMNGCESVIKEFNESGIKQLKTAVNKATLLCRTLLIDMDKNNAV